jgi:hypothetical protein
MIAVETSDGVAAGAGRPFVTKGGIIVEVHASCPLKDVAPDGRHIADLR